MENTYIIEEIVQIILKSQLFLLPVVLFALLFAKKKLSLTLQWKMHRGIIAALVLTPLLFLLPVEQGITQFSKNVVNLEIKNPEFVYQLQTYSFDFNTFSVTEKEITDLSPAAETAGGEYKTSAAGTGSEEKQQSLTKTGTANQKKNNNLPVFSLFGLISLLLGLASLMGIGNFTFQWVRQARYLSKVLLYAQKRVASGSIEIVYSSWITAPFSAGFIKKRIYLPENYAKKTKHIKAVMKHELVHIKEGHIYWTFVEKLLTALFWYNPYTHLLHDHGEDLREFLCDKAVSEKITPIEYGKALLDGAEKQISSGTTYYLSTGWRKKNIMKERLAKLFDKNNKKSPFTALLFTGAMIFTLFLLLGIASCVTPPPENSIEQTGIESEKESIPPAKQIKISIFTWNGGSAYLRGATALMAREYPHIIVDIEEFQTTLNYGSREYMAEFNDVLQQKLQEGSGPDIIWTVPYDLQIIGDTGIFTDLSPYMEKEGTFTEENYYMNILNKYAYNGEIHMLPITGNLAYRPFLLTQYVEESGIVFENNMITFQSLKSLDNKLGALQDTSYRLFDFPGKIFIYMTAFNYFADRWSSSGGITTFDSNAFMERVKKAEELVASTSRLFSEEDEETKTLTQNSGITGKPLELIMKNHGIYKDNITFLSWNEVENVYFQSYSTYGISSNSSHKDEAWLFFTYLLSPEIQKSSIDEVLCVSKEGMRKKSVRNILARPSDETGLFHDPDTGEPIRLDNSDSGEMDIINTLINRVTRVSSEYLLNKHNIYPLEVFHSYMNGESTLEEVTKIIADYVESGEIFEL